MQDIFTKTYLNIVSEAPEDFEQQESILLNFQQKILPIIKPITNSHLNLIYDIVFNQYNLRFWKTGKILFVLPEIILDNWSDQLTEEDKKTLTEYSKTQDPSIKLLLNCELGLISNIFANLGLWDYCND